MTDFNVIFDNGGGITIQTENWNHNYSDAAQAGTDAKDLLAGTDPSDWEGNDPYAAKMTCTYEDVRNGGAREMDDTEIAAIAAAGVLTDCWGYAMRDFFMAIGVTVNDDN
jgi:hypothetical protein